MGAISIGEAMAGGFRAITMPQRGLSEVRAEMSRRNENRMMILRSLSRSTSYRPPSRQQIVTTGWPTPTSRYGGIQGTGAPPS